MRMIRNCNKMAAAKLSVVNRGDLETPTDAAIRCSPMGLVWAAPEIGRRSDGSLRKRRVSAQG